MSILSTRPAVVLIKTRWRKQGTRTLAERAGVIGANVWKVSLAVFKNMEKEGFRFGSDRLVAAVLTEFIAFLVQLIDRAVYEKLETADRRTLISELANHLANTMDNNLRDLLGAGAYRKSFIDTLNTRFGEYAEFDVPGGRPDFSCVRFFATRVSEAMSEGDNKWVVEQMMDIEAPEMVKLAQKLVEQAVETPAP